MSTSLRACEPEGVEREHGWGHRVRLKGSGRAGGGIRKELWPHVQASGKNKTV